ncbi:hypothetical protein [Microbulbifer sp.]|uniref:hypothetical protein n=1 Tax=Microbulbifer sp. TaxID=1908541 RepID=UPI003F2A468B
MDLKEFIRESLVQISEGIIEANEQLKDTTAIANPHGIQAYSNEAKAYGRINETFQQKEQLVQLVDFDVALHADSGSEAGGGLKLSIASIGVDGGKKSTESSSSESRIKFSIPMVYPKGNV